MSQLIDLPRAITAPPKSTPRSDRRPDCKENRARPIPADIMAQVPRDAGGKTVCCLDSNQPWTLSKRGCVRPDRCAERGRIHRWRSPIPNAVLAFIKEKYDVPTRKS